MYLIYYITKWKILLINTNFMKKITTKSEQLIHAKNLKQIHVILISNFCYLQVKID